MLLVGEEKNKLTKPQTFWSSGRIKPVYMSGTKGKNPQRLIRTPSAFALDGFYCLLF